MSVPNEPTSELNHLLPRLNIQPPPQASFKAIT